MCDLCDLGMEQLELGMEEPQALPLVRKVRRNSLFLSLYAWPTYSCVQLDRHEGEPHPSAPSHTKQPRESDAAGVQAAEVPMKGGSAPQKPSAAGETWRNCG